MAEDNPTETTEKVEKIGLGIIKWLAWGVPVLIVLGVFFWGLLYSNYLANISPIISIRNSYQNTYWAAAGLILGNKTYPPTNPIYTIQPQEPLVPGMNTYTMIGSFEKLDADNALIYIKGSDQKTYIFRAEFALQSDAETWLVVMHVSDIQTLSNGYTVVTGGTRLPNRPLLSSYLQTLITNNQPAAPLSIVGVRWNDKRTLGQIENDFQKNPSSPLNDQSPESFVLAQFK